MGIRNSRRIINLSDINKNKVKIDYKEDSIKIIYSIGPNENYVRLFGDNFVKKNKTKCKMIINDKEYTINSIISFKNYGIKNSDKFFSLTLKGDSNEIDIAEMFLGCSSIKTDITQWKSLNDEINEVNGNQNKNEIIFKVEVHAEDIGKEVYFLDNSIYHDKLPELYDRNTKLYVNNEEEVFKKYFIPKMNGIYKIKLVLNIQMTNCSYMFSGCKHIINIDLSHFKTNNVANMEGMFYDCITLTEIDLSSFNTENVTNMKYMFDRCINLSNLDLSSFNTKNVIDMEYMFYGCRGLKKINLSSFDTKKVKYMKMMFYDCNNLKKIDLCSFNASNVSNLNYTFDRCFNLSRIKISRKYYNTIGNKILKSNCIIEI